MSRAQPLTAAEKILTGHGFSQKVTTENTETTEKIKGEAPSDESPPFKIFPDFKNGSLLL